MSSPTQKKSAKKKQKFCMHDQCNQEASVKNYCRLHYITNWKELKVEEKEKAEKRLNAYVDRMARRYPKDYLERIKEGLGDEEKFNAETDGVEEEPSENENEFLEKFLRDIKGDSE